MDDKKKIVLGSEDIITKGLQDMFININLQQTFNQIKKDKYDNNFDLAEQFRKERNSSRNFRIYGIIDSNIIDTDSFTIDVYKDSGLTQFYTAITTSSLVYEEKNIFNNKRGKYLLNLDNYDANFVYMKINGDQVTYADQTFEQQLVFHTVDGDFVEYGTQTVDLGLVIPGSLIIENDFPFFYNKHWVKKDIEIIETKKALVSFQTLETNVNEGNTSQFTIELDKPSPFGNEIVDLDENLVTAKIGDFSLSISGNPINLPTTLTWSSGEQFKTFDFLGVNDDFPEFSESLIFNMSNFQFVDTGDTISHLANIHDETPRNLANYNFGELYRNRYSFTGRTFQNSTIISNASSFSILRNGLKYERRNEEFYPNDTYELSIENKGNDTILPTNIILGTTQEELFLSGVTKSFNLSTKYTGVQIQNATQTQKIKVIFSGSSASSFGANTGYLYINGVNFPLANSRISYSGAKSSFTNSNINPLIKAGLEEPWTYEFNDTDKIITITSKSLGVPIDFSTIEINGPTNIGNVPIDISKIPIIEEIDNFVFYEQIPLIVKLAANSNANNSCFYEIILRKPGFSPLVILPTSILADTGVTDNFLITELGFVMRDWDNSLQECTFITGTTVETNLATWSTFWPNLSTPNVSNFIMPVDTAFINGGVLLSYSTLQGHQRNETLYSSAAFYPKKLLIEPCTDIALLPQPIKQLTKLTIPGVGSGNGTMQQLLQNNANSRRSFDFRTGITGVYTTFAYDNTNFSNFQDWKWASVTQVSGGTYGGINTRMDYILDLGTAPATQLGPVEGQDVNGNPATTNATTIYLESKVAGIPFEITNIINAVVHTSASNVYNQSVTAGDIIGPITTELIIPNAVSGGPNPARNFLGGFNPIFQLVP